MKGEVLTVLALAGFSLCSGLALCGRRNETLSIDYFLSCRGEFISDSLYNGHESKMLRPAPAALPEFVSEAQSLQVVRRFKGAAPDRPWIGYVSSQIIRQ